MLSKQANHALKALLELAAEPEHWRSTHELAIAQQLPEPMLEQILLRLRRAGLLEVRRGRLGGYRLAAAAGEVSLTAVLTGLGESIASTSAKIDPSSFTDQVTGALEKQLEAARRRTLDELTLEDLMFDLQSVEAGSNSENGLLLG